MDLYLFQYGVHIISYRVIPYQTSNISTGGMEGKMDVMSRSCEKLGLEL